ncbi:hypothetical protein [Actinomadura chibensis]|uniref:Uncharacterized protein n=1 Tax=Actinomadura chibensis TaxID=392828 RepID=A0A5D0NPK3_9ACTN|nr:hypothetical protein [Actinomadura chibensis]TYB46098.1 hypothetical protein FXF69_12380 [Actinomadura chibensis]
MKDATDVQDVAAVRKLLAGTDPATEMPFPADDAEARRALTRILATSRTEAEPSAPSRRTRRRLAVAVTVFFAFGALAAGADAAGVIPTGVVKALNSTNDKDNAWGDVDTSKAEMLIAAEGPKGLRAEWWRAPGKISGSCAYIRTVRAGGAEDGSLECGEEEVVPGPDTVLSARYGPLADDWMGVIGRAAPPAAQIKVKFEDGDERVVDVKAGGFFMQIFNRKVGPPVENESDFEVVELTALDAAGKVITTSRIEEGLI